MPSYHFSNKKIAGALTKFVIYLVKFGNVLEKFQNSHQNNMSQKCERLNKNLSSLLVS